MNEREKFPPMSPWSVDALRFTSLYNSGADFKKDFSWEKVTGTEPHEQRLQATSVTEEGEWQKGRLLAISAPNRFDWIYSQKQTDPETLELGPLGAFRDAIECFAPIIRKWLPFSRQPQRIAFAASLARKTDGRILSYNVLANYLPNVKIDPEVSRDFLYRINRPRTITLGNEQFLINRISTWSAIFRFAVNMMIAPNQVKSSGFGAETDHAVKLELDLSTDVTREEAISADLALNLFDVLIEDAVEISTKGDIP
jgi:hypothetical protein